MGKKTQRASPTTTPVPRKKPKTIGKDGGYVPKRFRNITSKRLSSIFQKIYYVVFSVFLRDYVNSKVFVGWT